MSEVSRAVMSALTWGLGFAVPANQITVVQSRLSREDLRSLLGPETADPSAIPAVPESPPTGSPDPKSPVPDTGLLEFSLGGRQGEAPDGSEIAPGRLELKDLQLEKHPHGGFTISVRLADNDKTIAVEREAAGTEEDSLEVPASAALDVIQEFLRSGRTDGAEGRTQIPVCPPAPPFATRRGPSGGGGGGPRPPDPTDRCRLCRPWSRTGLRSWPRFKRPTRSCQAR